MKKETFVLCVLLTSTATSYATNSADEIVGDAAAGKDKITTYNCVACHGTDGNSLAPNWPNLAGQHASYTIQQLKAFQSGARSEPSMTPMAMALKDKEQDMADIAAYYASQPTKVSAAGETLPEEGQKLYRGGNKKTGVSACSGCHSPQGGGNPPAKYPALSGQQVEYTKKQLMDYRKGDRGKEGSALIMRDIAAKLSDEEITAVANYVAGLK